MGFTREELIALADSAEERTTGYLRRWLKDPRVKAALRARPLKAVKT